MPLPQFPFHLQAYKKVGNRKISSKNKKKKGRKWVGKGRAKR
jgi:hypothetical protein